MAASRQATSINEIDMALPLENAEAKSAAAGPNRMPVSKSLLYAPLNSSVFRRPPQDDQHRRTKLTPSVQEPALHAFLVQVSRNYHETTVPGEARSAKALSEKEMADRIQSRALTFASGYYKKSAKRDSGKRANAGSAPKSRKRRRCAASTLGSSATNIGTSIVAETQNEFLHDLNLLWNDYIWTLLRQHDSSLDGTDTKQTTHAFQQVQKVGVEWIGASVEIVSCRARPGHDGHRGILVADTAQTWQVAAIPRQSAGGDDDQHNVTKRPAVVVIVPKRHSVLHVRLGPPPHNCTSNSDANNDCLRIELRCE